MPLKYPKVHTQNTSDRKEIGGLHVKGDSFGSTTKATPSKDWGLQVTSTLIPLEVLSGRCEQSDY